MYHLVESFFRVSQILLQLQTEVALMFDAVHFFIHALQQVNLMVELQTEELSCAGNETFTIGNILHQHMISVICD